MTRPWSVGAAVAATSRAGVGDVTELGILAAEEATTERATTDEERAIGKDDDVEEEEEEEEEEDGPVCSTLDARVRRTTATLDTTDAEAVRVQFAHRVANISQRRLKKKWSGAHDVPPRETTNLRNMYHTHKKIIFFF